MNLGELARITDVQMKDLKNFVEGNDIKDIMGREAERHFKESFVNEGFTDKTVEKWDDVKRRDPNSPWYGRGKTGSRFEGARTTAKILTNTGTLKDSIKYEITANGVLVKSSTPYAAVHQFGLQAKIYGKKAFQMIARPFMGKSMVLKEKIEDKIVREITTILTK